MKDKKHIVWFADPAKIDLSDAGNRRWWIEQVLLKGKMEDIRNLDFDEIERNLSEIFLPVDIRRLWEDYFEWKRTGKIN
ncbi:MAG: hypothetical protein FJ088_04105 [Deltaproteobacteria bacterium]|nr:hypothetical protein [Deltaproteobacteria bacterium]